VKSAETLFLAAISPSKEQTMGLNYGSSRHVRYAITDLYDEQRRTFLVQYPIWLIITLGLSGICAFALTGFLGYTNRGLDAAFRQPWLLFIWFCLLLLWLQISIFRHPVLRTRLLAVLLVSILSILVIFFTVFSGSLPEIIRQFQVSGGLLRLLGGNAITYSIINFGVIAVFWLDTIRRWIRRGRGLSPDPRVDVGLDYDSHAPASMPGLQELIAGDLIAAGIMALLLSALFQPQVVSLLIHPQGAAINSCTISWPLGHCVSPGGGIENPPTLSFIDLLQALLYLPLGIIILVLSATISGLGAVGAVNETFYTESRTNSRRNSTSSTSAVASDVTLTVIDTLRAALDRRVRLVASNFTLTLRTIAWPALIVLAIYGLGQLSIGMQLYLHSSKTLSAIISYGLPALVWGVVTTCAVVFSAALLVFRWRVAENTLRFIGLIVFVFLLVYWIFSLGLAGINLFVNLIAVTSRSPFLPLDASTYGSFALLVFYGLTIVIRRARSSSLIQHEQVSSVLHEKEQASDFDVLLLYDKQDAPYMLRRVVKTLRESIVLPFKGEVGTVALPQADKVQSAVICLGKHGAAFIQRQEVAGLLSEMAAQQIPVAVALFPGFRGNVPATLRMLPQVNLKRTRANVVTELEPFIAKTDPEENQAYNDRIEIVRQGLMSADVRSLPEIGSALLQLMDIKELRPTGSREFDKAEVWTGNLPNMGLQLPTGRITIFFRLDTPQKNYQAVLDRRDQDGAVLVVDLTDIPQRPVFKAIASVWIPVSDLQTLLKMNRRNLTRSVKRLITQQVNESLYPYKTFGVGVLFFGREEELKRLSGDQTHGGIIIGAHHSGKTNLLHKLKEELSLYQRAVIGPISSTSYQAFFDKVQDSLEKLPHNRGANITRILGRDGRLTMENFERTLRSLREPLGRICILIDEIDPLLEADETEEKRLTRVMRSLMLEDQTDFYLAGHSGLRRAISGQESPLRNFATEITLTGLDESSALRLIQEPMEQLGYSVTREQARRIYHGTAGAAWLIQHFCLALLHLGENHIDDAMIEKIEQNSAFLTKVWDYFEYGLKPTSKAILMMTALQPDAERRQLMERFAEHSVELSRIVLDEHLDFLVKFGVLQEDPPGFYHILPIYLRSALMALDPESLMLDYLKKTRSAP
jgi:hypothetical protein